MLPPQLTQRLLQLEMHLSQRPNLQTLSELIELYTVRAIQAAIEHYEEIQDPAYMLYKDQLQNVLRRKDVVSLYDASGELSARLDSEEDIVHISPRTPQLPISEKRRVERVVTQAEDIHATAKSAARDLFAQTQSLMSRLKARRKRHRAQQSSEGDKCGGFGSSFEHDLEQLLDCHLRKLADRENELAESLPPGDFPAAVAKLRAEADLQKRTDVSKLKAKYGL